MPFAQVVISLVFAAILIPFLVLAVYVAEHLDTGEKRLKHR